MVTTHQFAQLDAPQGSIRQGPAPGPLAVVHAAGALADGTLATLTPEGLERAFAPKVRGTWALHSALLSRTGSSASLINPSHKGPRDVCR